MHFLGQMLLVYTLLSVVLPFVTVAHHISDVLFRHVLQITIFELELHKHPAEDSIAPL